MVIYLYYLLMKKHMESQLKTKVIYSENCWIFDSSKYFGVLLYHGVLLMSIFLITINIYKNDWKICSSPSVYLGEFCIYYYYCRWDVQRCVIRYFSPLPLDTQALPFTQNLFQFSTVVCLSFPGGVRPNRMQRSAYLLLESIFHLFLHNLFSRVWSALSLRVLLIYDWRVLLGMLLENFVFIFFLVKNQSIILPFFDCNILLWNL